MNNSRVIHANQQSKARALFGFAFIAIFICYGIYFAFIASDTQSIAKVAPNYAIDEIPSTAIDMDQSELPITLNNDTYFFRDISNELSIHDIKELETAAFSKIEMFTKVNLGVSDAPAWLSNKLLISSKNPKHNRLLIEITHPQISSIDFFLVRGDGDLYKIEGNKQTVKNYMGHFNEVFPLPPISEEEVTIFIKLTTKNHMTFDLLLWSQDAFNSKAIQENFLFGLFYGSLGLMAFYNLLIYLQTREESYLYFVLYVSFLSCYQLVQLGHGQLLGYWSSVIFDLQYAPYYLWASCASIIAFVRSFLETKKKHRAINFCLNVSLGIILFQALTSLFTKNETTFEWLAYFITLVFFFVFFVIFSCYYLGNKNAKFLLWGWTLNMTGAFILALVYLDIIGSYEFLFHAPLVTLSIGSAFLTFALSERIKRNEKDALIAKSQAIAALSRYEDTFNNAIEGIYSLSLNGDFINANPALVSMLGYKSEAELKKNSKHSARLIYKNPEKIYQQLSEFGHTQEEVSFLKDNKPAWAIHSALLSYNKEGNPTHIEGSLVDISDQKLKELAQLRKEKEAIEKEEALHAAKAKSQFLANMSHELRTPLTAIIGYSEALTEEKKPEARKEYLDIIARSGNHLTELINDILDMSKVEENQLEINVSNINLFYLLSDTESYFKIKAQEKGLFFKVNYHWPLPNPIKADATRVKQILLNLCSNALKFTQQGGVTIDIKWLRNQQLLAIGVQDSGIGLTQAQQNKLFQSYAQADKSTTRQFGGTGLGLVISKQFAERMGGDITVSSKQGQGSVFTLTLGLNPNEELAIANNEQELSQLAEESEAEQYLNDDIANRILIVDSDSDCGYILTEMLNNNQRSITYTDNYLSTLEAIEDKAFDLALIDIDTLRSFEGDIKAHIKSLHTDKIIALTADVIKGKEEARTYGFREIIEKPFSKSRIYETINSLHKAKDQAK